MPSHRAPLTPPPHWPWLGQQLSEVFSIPAHLLPNVKVYTIDLYDTPTATVQQLTSRGAYPVCYFSSAYEDCESDWIDPLARFDCFELSNDFECFD